jgi:hypothetical protein
MRSQGITFVVFEEREEVMYEEKNAILKAILERRQK